MMIAAVLLLRAASSDAGDVRPSPPRTAVAAGTPPSRWSSRWAREEYLARAAREGGRGRGRVRRGDGSSKRHGAFIL